MKRIGKVCVRLLLGDITQQRSDAIVNAANSQLRPGGGVDGAIQRAAGPELLAERERARREAGGSVPAGSAVITRGGDLPAGHVIHAVGPVWSGGNAGERRLLDSAYRSALRVAKRAGLRTVCFPAISAGIYGYPLEEAAEVAVEAITSELAADPGSLEDVAFVLFDNRVMGAFQRALENSAKG